MVGCDPPATRTEPESTFTRRFLAAARDAGDVARPLSVFLGNPNLFV